jgi:O-antigen ligase
MESSKFKDITVEKLIFWGFCGMFFSIPIGTTPMMIFGLLTLFLWIFSGKFLKSKEDLFKNKKIFLPVLVFMAIPWIGLIYTEDLSLGWDFARKSYYWLFAFAIAITPHHSSKTFFKAFLVGLTITSLFSVLQFIDLIPMREWLPTVFAERLITMSLLLVLGISISSFYFLKENRLTHRILILFLMLLFLFTLSISGGRAGYLAFIALSPLIVYNLLGQKHIFGRAIVISILIFTAFFLLSPVVQHRFDQAMSDIRLYRQGYPQTSIGLRLHMWEGAVRIFLENPIIGVGTGGYRLAMEKFSVPALQGMPFRDPHNSFLHMAANHGIVGLISLGWLFLIILKVGWKHRHMITGFSVFSYGLVLLIGSLTATQTLTPKTGILFALSIGLCAKMSKNT